MGKSVFVLGRLLRFIARPSGVDGDLCSAHLQLRWRNLPLELRTTGRFEPLRELVEEKGQLLKTLGVGVSCTEAEFKAQVIKVSNLGAVTLAGAAGAWLWKLRASVDEIIECHASAECLCARALWYVTLTFLNCSCCSVIRLLVCCLVRVFVGLCVCV